LVVRLLDKDATGYISAYRCKHDIHSTTRHVVNLTIAALHYDLQTVNTASETLKW